MLFFSMAEKRCWSMRLRNGTRWGPVPMWGSLGATLAVRSLTCLSGRLVLSLSSVCSSLKSSDFWRVVGAPASERRAAVRQRATGRRSWEDGGDMEVYSRNFFDMTEGSTMMPPEGAPAATVVMTPWG